MDVELLVCHTTQEYWLLDAVGSSTKVTTEKQLTRFADDFGLPGTMVGDYRALMPGASVLDLYLAVMGDLTFGEYSRRLAELQARAGGRAFMSRFDRRRAGPGGGVRAWHCADVPFAFGTHTESVVEFLIGGPPSPADHLLSRRMVSAWASFAATGAPGGERLDASGGLPWAPLDVNGGGAVHVWTADGDRDGPPVTPTRQLWHDFEYRPLTP